MNLSNTEDFHSQFVSFAPQQVYHDLALDMDNACFAHGPCWEPTVSQFSISLSYVTGRWVFWNNQKSIGIL